MLLEEKAKSVRIHLLNMGHSLDQVLQTPFNSKHFCALS